MTLPTLTVELGRLTGWILGESLLGTDTTLATYEFDDITDKVLSASIRRGRQHELDRIETGTAQVSLLNQDGAFNAANTSSVYYPNIRPMVPIRIRATVVEAFDPLSITGLVAWYAFDEIGTLFQDTARTTPITADGQIIKGVTDKSGTANHLSEATNGPSYQEGELNALPIARFDGSNDQLSVTITADNSRTTFIVAKKTTSPSGANDALVAMGNSNSILYTNSVTSATALLFFQNQAAGTTTITGTTATNWNIMTVKLTSLSVMDVYANGGTPVNLDPNDVIDGGTAWVLGSRGAGSDPGDYDIAEVLIYNSVLSATDHNAVGDYLADKWALTWTPVS